MCARVKHLVAIRARDIKWAHSPVIARRQQVASNLTHPLYSNCSPQSATIIEVLFTLARHVRFGGKCKKLKPLQKLFPLTPLTYQDIVFNDGFVKIYFVTFCIESLDYKAP